MQAVDQGCAVGMVQAFEDAHSPHTRLICHIQYQYLVGSDMAACKGVT